MAVRRYLLMAAGATAALVVLYWLLAPRSILVETTIVGEGPFTAVVEEDGRTRVRNRYVVSAPLSGYVNRSALRAGDAVKVGQILATIAPNAPPLIEARTRQELEERVGAAQASVEEAGALEERAQALLARARSDLERTTQLKDRGVATVAQLDRETAAFQSAEREVAAADRHRHVAQHVLEQARAALRRSANGHSGERFAVSSPIAGQVLKVVQESEGAVVLGAPLIEVGDTSDLEVIVDLLTTDAARVRPGARVLLERTGIASVLEGRVRRIEPSGFTKISALGVEEQRVWIVADITSPRNAWGTLGDSYRVGVKIVVDELERALVVPVGALFRRGTDWTVFVVERGRAVLRKIELASRSGAAAAIAQGLKVGETVILFPPSTLKAGTAVRVQ